MAARKLTVNTTGWWVYRDAMRAGEDFTTYGNLHGSAGPATSIGWLPEVFWESARHASYVVYSYQTPIAWRLENGWFAPEVRYTVTTSKAQGRIFPAVASLNGQQS